MNSFSSDHDERDRKIIGLLKRLGSFESDYPPELFADTRASFIAKVEQLLARRKDRIAAKKRFLRRLKEAGSVRQDYPPELLAARRAAFLAQLTQLEQLSSVDFGEELSPADEKIIKLLGNLKSAEVEYPLDLLAARRSALLQGVASATKISPLEKVRAYLQSVLRERMPAIPSLPLRDAMRTSLVVASLALAAFIASLFFSHNRQLVSSQSAVNPTRVLPISTYRVATTLCKPGDPTTPCSSLVMDSVQDLADQANGMARPAVSGDASSGSEGAHQAAYVNDGRSDSSWVSKGAYSWIKIDLGKVTTIDSVSLQKGNIGPSQANNPGQFVIAVALSDMFYSDGNSNNDYTAYAQVFDSQQNGFGGAIPNAETIRTLFPPVKARYVKITFQNAGTAIDEVGVFMVQPPVLAAQPTTKPKANVPGVTVTLVPTNTFASTATSTAIPTETQLPTDTLTSVSTDTVSPTDTLPPTLTDTPYPSDTPLPSLTNTLSPTVANTATPVPTGTLPSDTPIPSPTAVPPTAIPPTIQQLSTSPSPIIITGNGQTLTFTCNGNDVELMGHANTVTLFGSCSSITVTGDSNIVYWQSGSPVITNKGINNIISQQ